MLDLNKKFESPEFIVPPETNYEKQSLIETLTAQNQQAAKGIATLDLTKTSSHFSLPNIGTMTRLEIFSFILVHTQRHIHQLRKIKGVMSEKVG